LTLSCNRDETSIDPETTEQVDGCPLVLRERTPVEPLPPRPEPAGPARPLQHPDGSFPEYTANEHGLAPTGFGIGYPAKTLKNLRQVNALRARRAQTETSLRAAMGWLLDPDNAIWTPPVHFANQVTAGLAGSACALTQFHDVGLRAQSRSARAGLRARRSPRSEP
jgi:hypothetical protein